MKTLKKRIETFSFFDHAGISRHLEEMASKGWMIEKLTNFTWVYHRIEPKKVKFTVSYYPKASEFDPEPSEEQKIFHEFCLHTGWKLACTSAQLQIFFNERENPVPIETEPTLEVESIHASAKKSFLPSYFLLLLISLMNGGLFISGMLGDPIGQFSSPTKLFTGFCFLVLFIICMMELVCYFSWYRKAMKVAEQGAFLEPVSTSKFQKVILIIILIGAIYWGINFILCGDKLRRWVGIIMCFYMPGLIFFVNATKNYLKRKKASRGVNRTITLLVDFVLAFGFIGIITFGTMKLSSMGFFAEDSEETYEHGGITWIIRNDELPLTVEDLIGEEHEGYIKERHGEESLLIGEFVLRQYPRFDTENYRELPSLEYTIVNVKLSALYGICKERLIYEGEVLHPTEEKRYEKQDASPWGANEVYRLYDPQYGWENDYLLCYDDILVEISFDWEPAAEQMQITGKKLNP
ncbi:MAG: DUF2812 domain-containing protein [Lachnospiraceae bacterium]|nr:DUF2812 domain-containing protein [Lachnospiraceae bacterium]